MRAVVQHEIAGPAAAGLADLPEPQGAHPRAGGERLLIEVHAAGVSFPDLLRSRGEYQNPPPLPFAIGSEVAGIVREAPPGSDLLPGERVAGLVHWGAVAELALGLPQYTIRLPEKLSFVEGAALYLNYSTAWNALDRVGLRSGETVLVHGAAGGVGTATLQLAAALGARSIAVVSSDAKERVARSVGADEVVRSDGDWLSQVRDLTGGRGVEAIVDPVGGDRFTDSLRALAVGGRLAVVGFAGGSIPTAKMNRLILKSLTLVGVEMDVHERAYPGTVRRVGDAVQRLADEGRVRPLIGRRLDFEQGAEALAILDRREAVGNLIVEVRSGATAERA